MIMLKQKCYIIHEIHLHAYKLHTIILPTSSFNITKRSSWEICWDISIQRSTSTIRLMFTFCFVCALIGDSDVFVWTVSNNLRRTNTGLNNIEAEKSRLLITNIHSGFSANTHVHLLKVQHRYECKKESTKYAIFIMAYIMTWWSKIHI